MAIKIGNKSGNKPKADIGSVGTEEDQPAATGQESEQTDQPDPSPQNTAPAQSPAVPGHQTQAAFLMTGNAQQKAVDQVKATQDLRSKLRGGAREFWLEPGQFAKLVFLDGTLLADNVFDTPMIATHMLQIGGSWHKLVCNENVEGECVICKSNAEGSQPNTVQLFTVVNVMPYTIQKGKRRGTVLPARLQLFPAALKTRDRLIKRAQNHGNKLAGGLYQMSRSDKQSARTGDDIEHLQDVDLNAVLKKYPMLGSKLNAKGEWEDAPTTVFDYAKVYPVLTNAEISALRPDIASMAGFTAYTPAGGGGGGFGQDPSGSMDDELPF